MPLLVVCFVLIPSTLPLSLLDVISIPGTSNDSKPSRQDSNPVSKVEDKKHVASVSIRADWVLGSI